VKEWFYPLLVLQNVQICCLYSTPNGEYAFQRYLVKSFVGSIYVLSHNAIDGAKKTSGHRTRCA